MTSKPVALYYETLAYQAENLAILREQFEVHTLDSPRDDTPKALAPVELCFAPLGYRFDVAKMDQCPRLRAIATNTTGVPHIDVDAARERDVAVISLKNEQAFLARITPTAEHTFGLLLALVRRTPWAHAAALGGAWDRRPFGAPAMLSRLSLGVVGYGRLGRLVAGYGKAFGMQVACYDPYVEPAANGSSDGEARRVDSLATLLRCSDVVSIHAPANASTRALIGRRELELLGPSGWLVNTARGELLDEAALLDALRDGRIAGAALDVLNGEFEPGFESTAHPLVAYAREHDNLLLTPHIGGSTRDAWRETERRVIDLALEQFG